MSDQTTDTSVDQTTEQAPAVQLQLQDLMLAAQVIQLASARGAIKPEEMTQVGGLYERLVTFLQASGAIKPAQEEPASDTAEESSAE